VHAISSRWLHRRHRNDQAAWAPAVLRAWFAWRQVRHEAWAAQARRALLEGDLQWQTRTGRLSMPD
jgi:hypothetical protein